jgi:hypothetical protein
MAPTSLGVIYLGAPDFSTLSVGIPFPLSTGQTVGLSSRRQSGPTSFQIVPGASDATLWVDTCVGTGHANCDLIAHQSVAGSLHVDASAPLGIRLDAVVADGDNLSVAPIVLKGTLTFKTTAPEQWCSRGE